MREALYTLTKNGKVWGNSLYKSLAVAAREARLMKIWDRRFHPDEENEFAVEKIAEWYADHYEIYFEREIIND